MSDQKSRGLLPIGNATAFESIFANASPSQYFVVYFWVDWAEPCQAMTVFLRDLANKNSNKSLTFLSLDAEQCGEVTEKFPMIESVPAVLVLDAKQNVLAAHEGADTAAVASMINKHVSNSATSSSSSSSSITTTTTSSSDAKTVLMDRLKKLTRAAPVMLFMKGSPDAPQCGFSRTIVGLLSDHQVQYGYFDILTDDNVRQGLKELSDWPTYPQLYVNGELLGGLDVVRDMIKDGEFADALAQAKPTPTEPDALQARLKSLIESQPVMLFMKGEPDAPQCGFSKTMVGILSDAGVLDSGKFGHFDILTDNEVRQGLKAYSDWPTYPQLYVNGELLGGLDVVRDMLNDGDEFADAFAGVGIQVSGVSKQ